MMAGIGAKDTLPELQVRRYLHAVGLRFRLHDKGLPGRPDIVLPAFCTAIFVHGCFWHRHPGCRFTTTPANNAPFWRMKFEGNMARDKAKTSALEQSGWRVMVVWECEARSEESLEALFWRIVAGREDL